MVSTPASVTILRNYSLPSILTAIIPGFLGPSMQTTREYFEGHFLCTLPSILALILVTGHYKVYAPRTAPLRPVHITRARVTRYARE
jgi:hypothetical protein